jgi:ABC-type nickel/cobalt efflux system permease component RcnA
MEILLTGFLAGLVHVLSGPDHLAAVAPYASKTHTGAWRSGFNWGIGHTTGVVVVGIIAVLLRNILPIEALSAWSERIVGVVLIGIGIWGLRAAFKAKLHGHEHDHDGHGPHTHYHLHTKNIPHMERAAHAHSHGPLGVGFLHGVAGSSHLFGVLPALALPSLTASFVYLAAFGIGSIGAMTGFSSIVGLAAGVASARTSGAYPLFLGATSFAAIVVGIVWIAA